MYKYNYEIKITVLNYKVILCKHEKIYQFNIIFEMKRLLMLNNYKSIFAM